MDCLFESGETFSGKRIHDAKASASREKKIEIKGPKRRHQYLLPDVSCEVVSDVTRVRVCIFAGYRYVSR